jgi:hypothetical protein
MMHQRHLPRSSLFVCGRNVAIVRYELSRNHRATASYVVTGTQAVVYVLIVVDIVIIWRVLSPLGFD